MTNTEIPPAPPAVGKRGVRLEIDAGPQPPERWSTQLDLLRAAGADWYPATPKGPRWRMTLTEDQLSAAVLDKLFHAAAEYGARVTVIEQFASPPENPVAQAAGRPRPWSWRRLWPSVVRRRAR